MKFQTPMFSPLCAAGHLAAVEQPVLVALVESGFFFSNG
jgi:hypothetical protein